MDKPDGFYYIKVGGRYYLAQLQTMPSSNIQLKNEIVHYDESRGLRMLSLDSQLRNVITFIMPEDFKHIQDWIGPVQMSETSYMVPRAVELDEQGHF